MEKKKRKLPQIGVLGYLTLDDVFLAVTGKKLGGEH